MKIVINACYGGFGLSREAVKKLAEWRGRECYFFRPDFGNGRPLDRYVPEPDMSEKGDGRDMFWTAFDIPNPNDVIPSSDGWARMTKEEKDALNAAYASHVLPSWREFDRADPMLLRVVEELGDAANGGCAKLKIVEIPDGVEYVIEECDGNEHVAEQHRTWS